VKGGDKEEETRPDRKHLVKEKLLVKGLLGGHARNRKRNSPNRERGNLKIEGGTKAQTGGGIREKNFEAGALHPSGGEGETSTKRRKGLLQTMGPTEKGKAGVRRGGVEEGVGGSVAKPKGGGSLEEKKTQEGGVCSVLERETSANDG